MGVMKRRKRDGGDARKMWRNVEETERNDGCHEETQEGSEGTS